MEKLKYIHVYKSTSYKMLLFFTFCFLFPTVKPEPPYSIAFYSMQALDSLYFNVLFIIKFYIKINACIHVSVSVMTYIHTLSWTIVCRHVL